ncbi:MAG: hypothetical protein RIB61_02645 [Roseicyclus sp.]
MPDHIRFLLIHAAIGFGLALAFVALLLAFDVAGLWHLVTHTSEGPLAVVMLVVFFTITFGSVQIGFRIMMLGRDDDDDHRGGPGGGRRSMSDQRGTVLVPVRKDERPRR